MKDHKRRPPADRVGGGRRRIVTGEGNERKNERTAPSPAQDTDRTSQPGDDIPTLLLEIYGRVQRVPMLLRRLYACIGDQKLLPKFLKEEMPMGLWTFGNNDEIIFNASYQPIWVFEGGRWRRAESDELIEQDVKEEEFFYRADAQPPWRSATTLRYCLERLATVGVLDHLVDLVEGGAHDRTNQPLL